MWTYFDRRARRLGLLDTKLAQGATFCFALIVAKLIPQVLTINLWVLVVLCILFAIKPILTFFGENSE
ncbi:MAG: hypothetical protein IFK94_04185 [Acidobacteria bacterium]|uniref:Uncharacterized protein n=1 Tax=Candidatus Polarisedimenticola svalbardensis TaxID=2886004 RepID=A0A8J7C1F8_9BACT|nr:hypothetical protein [Candidatus Polarisedimenticola svalbardensis]